MIHIKKFIYGLLVMWIVSACAIMGYFAYDILENYFVYFIITVIMLILIYLIGAFVYSIVHDDGGGLECSENLLDDFDCDTYDEDNDL